MSPIIKSTIKIRSPNHEVIRIEPGPSVDHPRYKPVRIKPPANLIIVFVQAAELKLEIVAHLLAHLRDSIPTASHETKIVGYLGGGLEWTDNVLRKAMDDVLYLEFREYYRKPTASTAAPEADEYHVECYDVEWSDRGRFFISVIGASD
jgi:hypothetical protein